MTNLYYIQRWGSSLKPDFFLIHGWITEQVNPDSPLYDSCEFLLRESGTSALTSEPGTKLGSLIYSLCMAAHYDRTVRQKEISDGA